MSPRRRFGQHFLRDEDVLRRVMAAMAVRAGERIVEIGPGDGALTAKLLRAGAQVAAVEIDRDLCAKLRLRFAEEIRQNQLRLTEGDALQTDLRAIAADAAGGAGGTGGTGGTARIAGNLPYNISTPLLLRLAEMRPADIHAMVQLEVAERLRARPGSADYGRLTATVGVSFAAEMLFAVSRESFWPRPRVDSAFVRLTPKRAAAVPDNFDDVLRRAFSSRRKTLANALRGLEVDWEKCGIDPSRRPQTVSPREFAELARRVRPAARKAARN